MQSIYKIISFLKKNMCTSSKRILHLSKFYDIILHAWGIAFSYKRQKKMETRSNK